MEQKMINNSNNVFLVDSFKSTAPGTRQYDQLFNQLILQNAQVINGVISQFGEYFEAEDARQVAYAALFDFLKSHSKFEEESFSKKLKDFMIKEFESQISEQELISTPNHLKHKYGPANYPYEEFKAQNESGEFADYYHARNIISLNDYVPTGDGFEDREFYSELVETISLDEQNVNNNPDAELLELLLSYYPERDREIFYQGMEAYTTLESTASDFGLSRERVRQVQNIVRRKILSRFFTLKNLLEADKTAKMFGIDLLQDVNGELSQNDVYYIVDSLVEDSKGYILKNERKQSAKEICEDIADIDKYLARYENENKNGCQAMKDLKIKLFAYRALSEKEKKLKQIKKAKQKGEDEE